MLAYEFLLTDLEVALQQAADAVARGWPAAEAPAGFRWGPQVKLHEVAGQSCVQMELSWVAIPDAKMMVPISRES